MQCQYMMERSCTRSRLDKLNFLRNSTAFIKFSNIAHLLLLIILIVLIDAIYVRAKVRFTLYLYNVYDKPFNLKKFGLQK